MPSVLLIAYLNLEGVKARIFELNQIGFSDIYVFLDGFNVSKHSNFQFQRNELERFLDESLDLRKITKLLKVNTNLGVGISVPLALDWFFSFVNSGLVLEDDCKLIDGTDFVLKSSLKLLDEFPNAIICLSPPEELDSTREDDSELFFLKTSLFSSWGWIGTRSVWTRNRVRHISLIEVWRATVRISNIGGVRRFLLALSWSDVWLSLRKNQDRLWAFRFTIGLINNGVSILYPSQKCIQHEPSNLGTNVRLRPKWDQVGRSNLRRNTREDKVSVRVHPKFDLYIVKRVHGATVKSLITRKAFRAIQLVGLK